jgi:hypothetical protein
MRSHRAVDQAGCHICQESHGEDLPRPLGKGGTALAGPHWAETVLSRDLEATCEHSIDGDHSPRFLLRQKRGQRKRIRVDSVVRLTNPVFSPQDVDDAVADLRESGFIPATGIVGSDDPPVTISYRNKMRHSSSENLFTYVLV